MKQATQDTQLLFDGDVFVGVNLGWDCTAEHEWGISGIKRALGIPEGGATRECHGFDVRKVSKVTDQLQYLEKDGEEYLGFFRHGNFEYYAKRFNHFYGDKNVLAAWSGEEFFLRHAGSTGHLRELYDEFQKNNIVVFLGVSGPFANGGLKICIVDRIPQEAREEASERDLNLLDLQEEAEDIGIYERIDESRYYALRPEWSENIKSTKDGEVRTE